MTGQVVLDVIIGTAYVYFFFSVIASGLNEWYARIRERRAKLLRGFIPVLLGSPLPAQDSNTTLATAFDSHPIIKGLMRGTVYPSYIPSMHFAMVIIDLAIEQKAAGAGGLQVRRTINGTKTRLDGSERRVIAALLADETNIRVVQARIEKWFTDSCERLSGEYKRRTYVSLLMFSLLVSVMFGVDTISLVRHLYEDPVSRQLLLASASGTARPKFPIGWTELNWWSVVGCPITALALTLGAPYWFDFVSRLVNPRQTGQPPGTQRPIIG